jgi:hypothetical protein
VLFIIFIIMRICAAFVILSRNYVESPCTIPLAMFCMRSIFQQQLGLYTGFELSKNKWGFDICLFIVIVITHRRFSIINNGGELKLTPPRVSQGILFGGVKQTTGGGSTPPNPPPRQFKHCLYIYIPTANAKVLRKMTFNDSGS